MKGFREFQKDAVDMIEFNKVTINQLKGFRKFKNNIDSMLGYKTALISKTEKDEKNQPVLIDLEK